MTPPPDSDASLKERPSLLVRGVGLLVLSAIAQVSLPSISEGDGARARLLVAWGEQVTFWLGIICVGGFVLAEVLRERSRSTHS